MLSHFFITISTYRDLEKTKGLFIFLEKNQCMYPFYLGTLYCMCFPQQFSFIERQCPFCRPGKSDDLQSDDIQTITTLALKYDISFSKLCQLGTMFQAICGPFQSQSKRKQNKISRGNGKKRIFGKKVHFWILKSCIWRNKWLFCTHFLIFVSLMPQMDMGTYLLENSINLDYFVIFNFLKISF